MNKINPADINALKFRDELIKLCNKYKCRMSASNLDNGDMNLQILDINTNRYNFYIMNNYYNNYSLYKENEDFYGNISIMEDIIKHSFDNDNGEMAGLNNIKVHCGVITNDKVKADYKFQELLILFKDNIKRYTISKDYNEIILNDNKRYVWITPKSRSRGYRCGSIIIDRNITLEELNKIIKPMCYACGRDDIEVF